MNLIFASNNINKLKQVKRLINTDKVIMPKDAGVEDFDVVEDGKDLRENAYKKARALYDIKKTMVFSDDTGLFVNSLEGRPGIYSHRYAGTDASDKDNRDKLLNELACKKDRSAYFKTVVCFIDESGKDYYFEGILEGFISEEEMGDGGFGYDKIFYVKDYQKTLAEMDIDFKNQISHRGKAIKNFKEFLDKNYENFNN